MVDKESILDSTSIKNYVHYKFLDKEIINFIDGVFKQLKILDNDLIFCIKNNDGKIIDLALPGEIDDFLSNEDIFKFKQIVKYIVTKEIKQMKNNKVKMLNSYEIEDVMCGASIDDVNYFEECFYNKKVFKDVIKTENMNNVNIYQFNRYLDKILIKTLVRQEKEQL